MDRRIYYIDCFDAEKKLKNIGFVKLEDDQIFMMLRGIGNLCSTSCKAYVADDDGQMHYTGEIPIHNGYGQAQYRLPDAMTAGDCCEVLIPLLHKCYGRCCIRKCENIRKEKEKKLLEAEIDIPTGPIVIPEPDKWTQLCRTYPQVHIFPEADTILIQPKDMLILTREYHELVSNSFLLHAYYNYRQLLLLRYHEKELCTYYLGVPGIYYEREKKIANMFGFEGFENGESRLVNEDRRRAYPGCFGYYMKQVEI